MSDYAPGETLTRRFATVNASGPATLTGGAVAVFKGTSVTPITAGVTLALDDIATGSHLVTVDTSADVVYSAPSDYAIVITVGATDQSLVGQPIGGFRLVETTVEDLKLDHVQQTALLTAIDVDVTAIRANTDNLPSAIKRNTARPNFEFFLASSSDHVSGATGLTVTAMRSIDGGPFASTVNAPVEVGNGVYAIDLDAADLNGEVITLLFTAAGADPRPFTIVTEP